MGLTVENLPRGDFKGNRAAYRGSEHEYWEWPKVEDGIFIYLYVPFGTATSALLPES